MGTIKSFTDLEAWKHGHHLVLKIYELTKEFPRDEVFGLVSQMRRCAVSITSNIAEGFSRRSDKEKLQFYSITLGSITELQNQLLICRDIGLMPESQFQVLANETIESHKLVNGLVKSIKERTIP